MNTTLIVDPVLKELRTYEELGAQMEGPTVSVVRWLRPRGLADACFGVVAAMVVGASQTLLDEDLSEGEIRALGVDPNLVGVAEKHTVPEGGSRGLQQRLRVALESSTARFTLYTSGSTGLPKAVAHSLAGLSRALRLGAGHERDVWGFAYNPTHIAGLQVMLQALFNGNPMVNLFGLPREEALGRMREHGVTHISATPSFYRLLFPADRPLTEVRSVTLGGERSDAALLSRLRGLFPQARLRNIYASTEAGTLLSADGEVFEIPERLRSMVRVSEGRLEVHQALLGDFPGRSAVTDGWYATGDVVEVVSEAPVKFRIVGRDRNWINVGGLKVNPSEVEAILEQHPAVREARVFGQPNSVLGQLVCAEIVLTGEEYGECELRAYLGSRLQAFKVPRVVRVVSELTRTRTGKLKRDV